MKMLVAAAAVVFSAVSAFAHPVEFKVFPTRDEANAACSKAQIEAMASGYIVSPYYDWSFKLVGYSCQLTHN